MSSPSMPGRRWVLAAPPLLLAACAAPAPPGPAPAPATDAAPPAAPAAPQPDAQVEIRKWQLGMIGKVAWGSGTLTYQGASRRFRLRALGIGGVGMARVRATGEVFGLTDLSQFPGVYGLVRAGVAAPEAELTSAVWLQNAAGVQVRLVPNRTGLALAIGADGVLIEWR